MKRNIKNIGLFIIAGFCFISCGKDFLSTNPSTQLSDEQIFNSIEKAQLVLTGAYDCFARTRWVHTTCQSIFFTPDVMGDDAFVNPTNNYSRFVSAYQYTLTPSSNECIDPWMSFYNLIDNINAILDNLKNLPEGSERNRIEGEALALRAFSYHYLVRFYAKPVNKYPSSPGVVLRTTSSFNGLDRSTVQATYKLIVEDLERAVTLLKPSNVKLYIDQKAAEAILARVYLDLGDETNGIKYAEGAVSGMTLMDQTTYLTKFTEVNSETLWSYESTATDNQGYSSIQAYWYYADGYNEDTKKYSNVVSGYNTLRVSKNLYNLIDNSDVRKQLFPLSNKGNLVRYPMETGGMLTTKFRSRDKMGEGSLNMIRGSEMYLIIAELAADNSHYDKARNALDAVRVARGLGKYSGSDSDLVNEIQLERRRELFGEGHRIFDIKRRNMPLKRTGIEGHTLWNAQVDLPAGSDRFELPIPQAEIDASDVLSAADQNPAYK